MKKRLGLIAVACLLCGLAAGGLAVWSYSSARTEEKLWPSLQEESVELDRQSDFVKGTPEEKRLIEESKEKQRAADESLASARRNSRLAVISGGGSIVLILIGIATIIINLKNREADSQ